LLGNGFLKGFSSSPRSDGYPETCRSPGREAVAASKARHQGAICHGGFGRSWAARTPAPTLGLNRRIAQLRCAPAGPTHKPAGPASKRQSTSDAQMPSTYVCATLRGWAAELSRPLGRRTACGESLRESRIREIRTSGLTRGEAIVLRVVPPLLYRRPRLRCLLTKGDMYHLARVARSESCASSILNFTVLYSCCQCPLLFPTALGFRPSSELRSRVASTKICPESEKKANGSSTHRACLPFASRIALRDPTIG
jgi:hypothetical protein